jgi:serine protease
MPPKFFAAGLLLAVLLAPPAHAQLRRNSTIRSPQALPQATPAAAAATPPEQPLQRIVIRFRTEARRTGLVAAGSLPPIDRAAAEHRIQALESARPVRDTQGRTIHLRHLKVLGDQAQVVRTSAALDRPTMRRLLAELARDPQVEYAEIDERAYAQFTPNDTDFASQQWNLKAPASVVGGANFTTAWDRTASGVALTGTGVVVAVLDGGYQPHADLAANLVLPGYDFVDADSGGAFTTANDGDGRDADATDPGNWNTVAATCDVADSSWHGTHVAGTIAAVGNNNQGIAGAAFGAKVLPVRVLGVCGGFISDISDGMRWAAGLAVSGAPANANPAKVLNLSLGGTGACGNTYQNAVDAVRAAGAVVVAATGNSLTQSNVVLRPANCSGVIAVTAHASNGGSPTYANIGSATAISAPGDQIYATSNAGTTVPGADAYATKNGTSMAAPHVSAAIALMLQAKPDLTPDQVRTALVTSARAFPAGSYCVNKVNTAFSCGAGLLDADAAVDAALNPRAVSTGSSGAGGGGAFGTLDLALLAAWMLGATVWPARRTIAPRPNLRPGRQPNARAGK